MYQHPVTGRRHGMGSNKAQAIEAAKELNALLMKDNDLAKDDGPWSSLPAAAEGRTRFIDPDILLRPGPRMVEGVQQLREAISKVGGAQE